MKNIQRGDVYLCDLSPTVGSEQGGSKRPVVVIQNNIGCKFSPVVFVVSITSQIQKAKMPTHIELNAKLHGLERDSVCLGEQARTIDKSRLVHKLTTLDEVTMKKIFRAVMLNMADDETFDKMKHQPELITV
ncbi:type II toxin-antitoxin system PemK/MazF family toxin [Brevibacillus brevis]|uniref:type II toxin-antitoxin system PemK/MazF family toxin n=1 Tax=Brevibacillus brevis TaxID=1393 RepID=UPI0007D8A74D|nr:type II toxin-antitoxin system PemK/MazF family toxin [Brevibacillus brevis]